jgi:hypothetical protein
MSNDTEIQESEMDTKRLQKEWSEDNDECNWHVLTTYLSGDNHGKKT